VKEEKRKMARRSKMKQAKAKNLSKDDTGDRVFRPVGREEEEKKSRNRGDRLLRESTTSAKKNKGLDYGAFTFKGGESRENVKAITIAEKVTGDGNLREIYQGRGAIQARPAGKPDTS